MKKSLYEKFKKYQVEDVKTVGEFCNRYYRNDRFKNRGIDYMKAVIDSNTRELEECGYTFITHHDSITGECVSFYK